MRGAAGGRQPATAKPRFVHGMYIRTAVLVISSGATALVICITIDETAGVTVGVACCVSRGASRFTKLGPPENSASSS